MLQFNVLAQQLLNGGFTVDIAGHCPEDGYMVSPYKGAEETEVYENEPKLELWIECFFERHSQILRRTAHYVGGWSDNRTGHFYLDVSVRVTNRSDAILLCKLHNQLAYYDVAKKETVYV